MQGRNSFDKMFVNEYGYHYLRDRPVKRKEDELHIILWYPDPKVYAKK